MIAVILCQLLIVAFGQVTTITEDFSITHLNHPSGDNWGVVEGVNGIQREIHPNSF